MSQDTLQQAALETILSQLAPPKLTDAQVLALAFLVPQDMLLAALELIDTHSVHRVTAPYGSTLYTVAGSAHPYLVSPRMPSYCPCPAFAFSLVSAGSGGGDSTNNGDEWAGLCKHLLALRLALALDAIVHDRLDAGEKTSAEDQTLALLKRLELVGP